MPCCRRLRIIRRRHGRASIKYVTQLPTRTPQFAFFCNLPQWVKDPYKRFLENKLREHFDFEGCPIQVYTRAK